RSLRRSDQELSEQQLGGRGVLPERSRAEQSARCRRRTCGVRSGGEELQGQRRQHPRAAVSRPVEASIAFGTENRELRTEKFGDDDVKCLRLFSILSSQF